MNPLSALLESLDLAPLGDDRFEAMCVERARPRVFGGELLAQALVAASRTVKDRSCHALHVRFVRPGDATLPIEYRVRPLSRDGRRFSQRDVTGLQHGREILIATVSFALDDDSPGYQHAAMPDVPGPEALRSELDHRRDVADRLRPDERAWLLAPRAVEVRQVAQVPLVDPSRAAPVAHTWLRAISQLPDEPAVHQAVLAYASDMTLLDVACYPHGLSWIDPRMEQASLSHAIWFHRPVRADEWLLYAQTVPIAAAGRALACGSVFTRSGTLVASVAQEGISRRRHS